MSNQTELMFSNPLHNSLGNKEVIIDITTMKKKPRSIFYSTNCKEAWISWIYKDQCSLLVTISGISCCLVLVGLVFLTIWGITELMNPN
jgi:hypothetical protein